MIVGLTIKLSSSEHSGVDIKIDVQSKGTEKESINSLTPI